jgi:hypothetical protein
MTLLERLQQPKEPTRKPLVLTAPWGREVRRILWLKHTGQLSVSFRRIAEELTADGSKVSEGAMTSWGNNAQILEQCRQEFEADATNADHAAGPVGASRRPDNPPAERGRAQGRRR